MKISGIIAILLILMSSNFKAQDNIQFYGETVDNEEINFSDINSKGPTLINFWALWCKPCRAEMKHLVDIYNKYSDKDFTILAINQDTPRSLAKVKSFASSHKISFPVIKDPNQEIFQQFNGQSIPLSILYNSEGKVVYSQVGYLPGDEVKLEAEVRKVLGLGD
ncbi:MAG: TlpA disulfide reductase family protein [Melioribacteraceae bacterium]|nr:TlpA disulfide reductase family protein [Melioribacteraceae bacterium]